MKFTSLNEGASDGVKKIVLLFLLAMLLPAVGQSQHRVTKALYPYPIVKTIVKEYVFPATISYVETTSSHYFSYSDATLNIVNCEIDNNLFVLDFVIFNDVVYFCGYDTLTLTKGVWGTFNTNDLMQGNLSYETYSNFDCNKVYSDTLNSLVAYNNNGVTTIVTVGSACDGVSKPRGCTIEITPSGQYAWNYTMGVTPDTNMEIEKHVCLTDNYVISSGFTDVSSGFEVYRRHTRNNIFSLGGPQDFMWCFPTSNNPRYTHQFHTYAITHIGGDTIAAALSYENLTNPGYGVIVKTYDMSNPVIGLTNSSYVYNQNTMSDLLSVQGLKYDRINKNIVVLLYGETPLIPNHSSIVAEIPMTTSTTTYQFHYSDEFKMTSIDLYNSNQSFICQGINRSSYNLAHYFTQPLATVANCATTLSLLIPYEIYIVKGHTHPYSICKDFFKCTSHQQLSSFIVPNDITCSN